MTPFAEEVVSFVRRRSLIPEGARVMVALSGGPDSCALLLSLLEAANDGALPRPVAAAHFHHGVRGKDADEDAAFCATLCARYALPCVIGLGTVPRKQGGYDSATARRMRYAFLQEAAGDMDANTLATAHTFDDQAETVLGRVLRGTSVDGVAGIPVRRTMADLTVVRPVLGMRRRQIEDYCAGWGISPRHDPSNDKDRYTRTRLRRLLPELANGFNPRLPEALNRLAENAALDSDLISHLAEDLAQRGVRERGNGFLALDRQILADAHPALRRRVLIGAIREMTGPQAEEAATLEWVLRLEALATESGQLTLPGTVRVVCRGDDLLLEHERPVPLRRSFYVDVPVPGEVVIEGAALALTCEVLPEGEEWRREPDAHTIVIAADPEDAGSGPLVVRPLAIGERFRPFGLPTGSRLVRDVLSEKKIPVKERESYPVLARADTGEILWVIGIAQSETTRVRSSTRRRLRYCAYSRQTIDVGSEMGKNHAKMK